MIYIKKMLGARVPTMISGSVENGKSRRLKADEKDGI